VHPLDHLALRGKREAPALVLRDEVLSHEGLNRRVGQLAAWLAPHAAPARRGWRVATWLGKGLIACLMPLAAVRAGLVHVPINPVLRRAQVAHILADSGAALLMANAGRLDTLEPGDAAGAVVHDEAAVAGRARRLRPAAFAAAPDDLAAILYTSGSTGKPKGVMLSQANLWLGAISVAHYLGLAADDRVLAVLPLAFDYGQNQLLGAGRRGLRRAAGLPVAARCGARGGAPRHHHAGRRAAAVGATGRQDWPDGGAGTLRRLTNSGGALTPIWCAACALAPQARLFAMYGLTEAFRSTFLDPALIDAHPTSIGTAIPFAEVMVVNDAGEAARPARRASWSMPGRWWRRAIGRMRRARPNAFARRRPFRRWAAWRCGRATGCGAMAQACCISSGGATR
jgi:acyl-CoA synthetase (AMP-forming)/AMP-acid ligase II